MTLKKQSVKTVEPVSKEHRPDYQGVLIFQVSLHIELIEGNHITITKSSYTLPLYIMNSCHYQVSTLHCSCPHFSVS